MNIEKNKFSSLSLNEYEYTEKPVVKEIPKAEVVEERKPHMAIWTPYYYDDFQVKEENTPLHQSLQGMTEIHYCNAEMSEKKMKKPPVRKPPKKPLESKKRVNLQEPVYVQYSLIEVL